MAQDPIKYARRLERQPHGGRARREPWHRDEPYDWSSDRKPRGSGGARRRGALERVVVGLLSLAGFLFAQLVALRLLFEVFTAVDWFSALPLGCAIASLALVNAGLLRTKRCRAYVGRYANLAAIGLLAAFLAGAVLAVTGADPMQTADDPTESLRPASTRPLLTLPELSLPSAHHAGRLVNIGGSIWQYGGRRVTGPAGRPVIQVPARIDAVEPCGGGLLIAFGSGFAGRYSARTGRPLGAPVQVGTKPLAIACGARSAFLGIREQGLVLRVAMAHLAVQEAWIEVGGEIGALLVRSGITLLVGDVENSRVADVSLARNVVDHYVEGVREPKRLVPTEVGAASLAPNLGCLRTLSAASGEADREGLNVPGHVVGAGVSGEWMLALANGGYWMQRIHLPSMTAGPLVEVPGGVAAADVAPTRAGWVLLITDEKRRLLISSHQYTALERASRGKSDITVGGPCV